MRHVPASARVTCDPVDRSERYFLSSGPGLSAGSDVMFVHKAGRKTAFCNMEMNI